MDTGIIGGVLTMPDFQEYGWLATNLEKYSADNEIVNLG
jgi:hypothetical protein